MVYLIVKKFPKNNNKIIKNIQLIFLTSIVMKRMVNKKVIKIQILIILKSFHIKNSNYN